MKKDNFFIYKFLPIVFIVLFISIFICTSCFAATDVTNNVTPYGGDFPNDLKALPEYQSGKYFYYAFSVSRVNYVIFIEKLSSPLCYIDGSDLVFNGTYNTIGYTFSYSGSIDVSSRYTNTISRQSFNRSDNNNKPYFASNSAIYTDNTYKDVFFPLPQTRLGQEVRKAKILQQLKTMVTGYLKYLVALVASLIAFWKGWQFLLKTFKKA